MKHKGTLILGDSSNLWTSMNTHSTKVASMWMKYELYEVGNEVEGCTYYN
jgi:hypothetical protein